MALLGLERLMRTVTVAVLRDDVTLMLPVTAASPQRLHLAFPAPVIRASIVHHLPDG